MCFFLTIRSWLQCTVQTALRPLSREEWQCYSKQRLICDRRKPHWHEAIILLPLYQMSLFPCSPQNCCEHRKNVMQNKSCPAWDLLPALTVFTPEEATLLLKGDLTIYSLIYCVQSSQMDRKHRTVHARWWFRWLCLWTGLISTLYQQQLSARFYREGHFMLFGSCKLRHSGNYSSV